MSEAAIRVHLGEERQPVARAHTRSLYRQSKETIMAMEAKLSQYPHVAAVVRAAIREYRMRAADVVILETCPLLRNYTYVTVDLSTKQSTGTPETFPRVGAITVAIPRGVAIVRGGLLSGKPSRARVYVHPLDSNSLFRPIGS